MEDQMKTLTSVLLAVLFISVPCYAEIKTIVRRDSISFDPAGIPPGLKSNFDIMKAKCSKCHSLERTVVATTTGIAPITGQPFDHSATRACAVNMSRKMQTKMTKEEAKAVVDLLNYLIAEAAR
jgi:hypothetical protein